MVTLLFPPLVESNFGAYYPSTAVLAAFLEKEGFATAQIDLNEFFAMAILKQPESIMRAFSRMDEVRRIASYPRFSFAMTVLQDSWPRLIDESGKHRFREDRSALGRLLSFVARQFQVEKPLAQFFAERAHGDKEWSIFTECYSRCDLLKRAAAKGGLIGISVAMGPQLVPTVLLAEYLKSNFKGIHIVLGGPAISLMATNDRVLLLKSCPSIDALVRFDGEIPLSELARQVQENSWRPEAVSGCSTKVGSEISEVPPRPGEPLDALPFAKYDPKILDSLHDPELGIVVTRGCYWGKCAYCDFVELYEGSPAFRTRSTRQVIAEMRHQSSVHGIKRFCIVTEALPPAMARRMTEAMTGSDEVFTWNSFAMVDDRFDRDLMSELVKTGCEYLIIGMETMNDRVLNLVRKAANARANRRFVEDAFSVGLQLKVNIIPDLPTTTFEEGLEALHALKQFGPALRSIAIFPFEATRSSDVGRDPSKFGLQLFKPEWLTGQAEYPDNHLPSIDPAMSPEQRSALISAYRAFASEATIPDGTTVFISNEALNENCRMRIDAKNLYVRESHGSMHCFNYQTGELWEGPAGWEHVITMAAQMGEFERDVFVGRFSPNYVGLELLRQLADHRLLVDCARDAVALSAKHPATKGQSLSKAGP